MSINCCFSPIAIYNVANCPCVSGRWRLVCLSRQIMPNIAEEPAHYELQNSSFNFELLIQS